jgi:hypothetical protein
MQLTENARRMIRLSAAAGAVTVASLATGAGVAVVGAAVVPDATVVDGKPTVAPVKPEVTPETSSTKVSIPPYDIDDCPACGLG